MQKFNENEWRIRDGNSLYEFVAYTTVGDREEQQDSFGYQMKSDALLAVLCDGMGGHNGGAAASKMAVSELLYGLDLNHFPSDVPNAFLQALRETDIKVASLQDNNGNSLGAGTTAITVILKNDALYWCSVGDSRIYLIRENEMIQVTSDHVYQKVLDQRLNKGEITQSEYNESSRIGEALVSFLGVGNLPMTDINQEPFTLQGGDIILLTSDGLYKYLSEKELKNIISNFSDLSDAVEALDAKVKRGSKKTKVNRDNMTTIIIRFKRSV